MNVRIPNPCHKCSERVLHCHSKCDKYKAYKDKIAEDNEIRNKIRSNQKDADEVKFRAINGMKKRCKIDKL